MAILLFSKGKHRKVKAALYIKLPFSRSILQQPGIIHDRNNGKALSFLEYNTSGDRLMSALRRPVWALRTHDEHLSTWEHVHEEARSARHAFEARDRD
ncbi:hypothetical protein KM043_003155 [Ampulex compressa]|nr:hypothetical protein KM043_003155 [Ampulex compressa]